MGVSDKLVGALNFLTFILSLPIIGAGIWLTKQNSTECYRFLQGPVIALGVFILVVSLAGFVGSCCRSSVLLYIYLVIMFLLIILLFVFTVFVFVVTNRTASHAFGNKGYKEYKLGDYSTWLQRQVNQPSHWQKIKTCISDSKLCDRLRDQYHTKSELDDATLSPIQNGCCRPPAGCDCTFVNATYWKSCKKTSYSSDCKSYSSKPTNLCFNCDSCRAGVLQSMNKDWRLVAKVNVSMLIFLIVVYSVGCCAFRNVRNSGYYKSGWA